MHYGMGFELIYSEQTWTMILNWSLGSEPIDVDLGSYEIINSCHFFPEIRWDHRCMPGLLPGDPPGS